MVNRINARIIPHRSPPDNFHQHAPQRRPHILIFLRSVVAILLLAICAVAAAAQTGADSSSIRAIQAALQARDNEKALTLVRTQLQAWPKDVRLWALEGIALTQLGRNHEALIAYNKALALSPDYLAALEGAAELEYKAGSIRAVPLLNRILKVRPDEPTTHAMLAALAYKKHDCAAAVEHFQKSAPVLSAQPTALEEYGACLMDLQKPDEAVPVFEQILALLPNGPHARYNLAVAQFTAQHSREAITTLQPLLDTSEPEPDVLDLASAAYEETGETPRAVSLLRQAIVANPHQVKYYVDFAALSYKHESFQVGVEMIDAGLTQLPKAAPLYIARGILYIQMGQFEKGQSDFEAANRLDPGQASAAVAQGLAQLQASNLDQALKTVETELKAHPDDAFLHYLKAEIISQGGPAVGSPEFNEAVKAASRAVQLQPDFPLARNVLGNLYLQSGQNEKAIEQCRVVLRENPSDQIAVYHLLLALRKINDPKGEVPALVKRLAELRTQSQQQEASTNRYKLYIQSEPAPDAAEPRRP
ncbi:MAG TPA: tetratricopeptide repeat protein [Candidatus Acidoferrales bacterium]|jgi:tetratricopeptide (TPR) repeat protein|nr:tetratricopeptide repeat protein [Candidatus Acidoferrales bacterium]